MQMTGDDAMLAETIQLDGGDIAIIGAFLLGGLLVFGLVCYGFFVLGRAIGSSKSLPLMILGGLLGALSLFLAYSIGVAGLLPIVMLGLGWAAGKKQSTAIQPSVIPSAEFGGVPAPPPGDGPNPPS
jgi:hypothetical protein